MTGHISPTDPAAIREAFHLLLDELEPAKAALADSVPGPRMPGRPLHDALDEFTARLERARSLMPAWRCPELEDPWHACDAALGEALDLGRRAVERAHGLTGFEPLLGLVQDLLDVLEPFAEAEAALKGLGRRKGRWPVGKAPPEPGYFRHSPFRFGPSAP